MAVGEGQPVMKTRLISISPIWFVVKKGTTSEVGNKLGKVIKENDSIPASVEDAFPFFVGKANENQFESKRIMPKYHLTKKSNPLHYLPFPKNLKILQTSMILRLYLKKTPREQLIFIKPKQRFHLSRGTVKTVIKSESQIVLKSNTCMLSESSFSVICSYYFFDVE